MMASMPEEDPIPLATKAHGDLQEADLQAIPQPSLPSLAETTTSSALAMALTRMATSMSLAESPLSISLGTETVLSTMARGASSNSLAALW